MTHPVVSRDPDVMGGTPVFRGTRVPVQTLIEYLDAGETFGKFLDGFPSVTREQVVASARRPRSSLSNRSRENSARRMRDLATSVDQA